MTRDDLIGILAGTIAATVSTIMCAACLVGMHVGTAQAEQPDVLEASEQPFEPPAEPEPEPCGLTVDQAPEEAWEEPAYCETQYAEPTYAEPAYVEPAYYEPEPTYYEPAYAEPAPTYYEPVVSADPSEVDLKTAGVVYDGDTRYTWYGQGTLPGGGLTELNNNGRTVDERGFVTDGDGYIAVASSDLPKGTHVDTPWGEAVVYDTGCATGTIDVYTDWG